MSTSEVLIICIVAFICADGQHDVTLVLFNLKGSLGRTRTIPDDDASGDEIGQTMGTYITLNGTKCVDCVLRAKIGACYFCLSMSNSIKRSMQ